MQQIKIQCTYEIEEEGAIWFRGKGKIVNFYKSKRELLDKFNIYFYAIKMYKIFIHKNKEWMK